MKKVSSNNERDLIRHMVRTELGCGCPDDVFDEIRLSNMHAQTLGWGGVVRLVIGNRLLIYLAGFPAVSDSLEAVDELVSIGVKDRDVNGLNRARVVFCGPASSHFDSLSMQFGAWLSNDEKVHLHICDLDKIPLFISRLLVGKAD